MAEDIGYIPLINPSEKDPKILAEQMYKEAMEQRRVLQGVIDELRAGSYVT